MCLQCYIIAEFQTLLQFSNSNYRWTAMFIDNLATSLSVFIFLACHAIGLSNGPELIETPVTSTNYRVPLIHPDNQCPLLFRYSNATEKCECYIDKLIHKDIVKCSKEGAALIGYNECVTYDEDSNTISVGFCSYFEIQGHIEADNEPGFVSLPDNISELNSYMCEPMNRRGLLCNECKDGYGLSATSTKLKCCECTMNVWAAVLLNLLLEIIPVFVFYVIILVFQISITSPPMPSFILFSNISLIIINYNLVYTDKVFYADNALVTLYAIWTLDFFRHVVPPVCISPRLNALHIHYIQNISTIFPFILIVLTYVSIELHSCNFKLVVWTWKALDRTLLKHVKVKRDSERTVVDTFATFFLLSFAKLTITLLLPLHPIRIHDINNSDLTTSLRVNSFTYPSDKFLSSDHLPLVVVSLSMFVVFLLPPVFLLTLYPFRPFRSLIFKYCPKRFKGCLNIFLEKYNFCYRDGLNGGRDMRSLASLYFFFILFVYMFWTIHKSYFLIGLLSGGCSLMVAIVQPYKKKYMNVADALIFANIAIVSTAFDRNIYALDRDSDYRIALIICFLFPLLELTCLVVYKLFHKRLRTSDSLHIIKMKLKPLLLCLSKDEDRNVEEGAQQEENLPQNHNEADTELPDRMNHPERYIHPEEDTF